MYAKRYKIKKLKNGATVIASTFGEASAQAGGEGIVTVVGSIYGGALPWGTKYAADIHAEMLLEGTSRLSKDELSRALDDIGASIQFSSSTARLVFSAQVRAVHVPRVLLLIAEILTDAVFTKERLDSIKKRMSSELDLAEQDTRIRASVALSQLMYPKGHALRQEGIKAARKSLAVIKATTLTKKHSEFLKTPELLLSIAGDISQSEAFVAAQAAFSQFASKKAKRIRYIKAAAAKKKMETVTIKEKSSIDYMLGIPTRISNDHKDYAALVLGLQVLGNPRGFAGRLMKTTREEEGLTYGVYAYASGFSGTTDGAAMIWATFSPELFQQGRASIHKQITRIVTEAIDAIEIKKHQELYVNYRIVQLSTTSAYARAAHDCIVDGKTLAYLDSFPKQIQKLSRAGVTDVLKKYLVLKNATEVAAGPIEKSAFKA